MRDVTPETVDRIDLTPGRVDPVSIGQANVEIVTREREEKLILLLRWIGIRAAACLGSGRFTNPLPSEGNKLVARDLLLQLADDAESDDAGIPEALVDLLNEWEALPPQPQESPTDDATPQPQDRQ